MAPRRTPEWGGGAEVGARFGRRRAWRPQCITTVYARVRALAAAGQVFRKREPMPNRLATETSPYLRQHADNPVDWYPWGREALERARQDDRPILLSVGYAA